MFGEGNISKHTSDFNKEVNRNIEPISSEFNVEFNYAGG
jgi:hypothetical protein